MIGLNFKPAKHGYAFNVHFETEPRWSVTEHPVFNKKSSDFWAISLLISLQWNALITKHVHSIIKSTLHRAYFILFIEHVNIRPMLESSCSVFVSLHHWFLSEALWILLIHWFHFLTSKSTGFACALFVLLFIDVEALCGAPVYAAFAWFFRLVLEICECLSDAVNIDCSTLAVRIRTCVFVCKNKEGKLLFPLWKRMSLFLLWNIIGLLRQK